MSDDRRYYGLDALRGTMMMLGILVHAAIFYIAAPAPHMPLATDPNKSLFMDAVVDFIHIFRMPTFFVLAGFFAALLVEKRGVAGAYRNRLARIVGPMVAAFFTLLPVCILFMLDFSLSVRYGVRDVIPARGDLDRLKHDLAAVGALQGFPVMHLWFLLYLCYFYLLIPFCRLLVRASLPHEARVARFLGSPIALPVFAFVTALTLWPYPGAQVFGEFIMLGFSPPAFAYYGFFFVLGYVYHHYRASTANLVRYLPWCAVAAGVLFPITMYASRMEYAHPEDWALYHVGVVAVHALCTWSLVWLLAGVALRYFDRPTAWALYASQAAYWVYLLHLPVVCVMAWLLVPVDVHAVVKFFVIVTVTVPACVVTYHYWVQDTWLGAFLNGKRFKLDWPWRGAGEGARQPV